MVEILRLFGRKKSKTTLAKCIKNQKQADDLKRSLVASSLQTNKYSPLLCEMTLRHFARNNTTRAPSERSDGRKLQPHEMMPSQCRGARSNIEYASATNFPLKENRVRIERQLAHLAVEPQPTQSRIIR
ncbi:hypothetical protein BD410DRAFT_782612 [Rickenella mellea]|uniref:Uncharacterized protein n=1 Tax=Rickenella mellea TaxID=50990 RepID=A0A4Y7QL17_9AGAM|nr:hypothetical protein BD410DRAFT_782612 [Rickenella mellea]